MADEPDNHTLALLREMRADMKAGFSGLENRVKAVDLRFDRLEKKLENIRQLHHADSILGRYTVAEVDERLDDITRRLEALETRR